MCLLGKTHAARAPYVSRPCHENVTHFWQDPILSMNKVILYIDSNEQFEVPEADPCWATLAEYDPRDPASLERARESVRKQFSLNYLPVLCNEPEPGFFETLLKKAGGWFERHKPNARSAGPIPMTNCPRFNRSTATTP